MRGHDTPSAPVLDEQAGPAGTSRRRFLAYLVGAPTLAVAVRYAGEASAVIPGTPEPADFMDLGDLLILSAKASEPILIQLVLEEDGTVSCALPREEAGQGITTACTMLIADELDLPMDQVRVTLAPARVELLTGQLTGGSNTIRSVYEPIRMAAASMRGTLMAAAAREFGGPTRGLTMRDGVITSPDGDTASFAALATKAADPALFVRSAQPRAVGTGALVGTPQNRVDARRMVTGSFEYTNDLDPVPGALRAMVRRPPTIRGAVVRVLNEAAVRAMPGVRDLFVVVLDVGGPLSVDGGTDTAGGASGVPDSTGVAVLADTFGQALDAKEALEVEWVAGPVDPAENDETLKAKLQGIQLPFATPGELLADLPALPAVPGLPAPAVPALDVVEGEFYFHFASHAPLETNTAIADVTAERAIIWGGTKVPVLAQQFIEQELGVPTTVNVIQGGGSFGRRLFFDGILEAARISTQAGVPVKVMMTRIDDMRHGRARAASVNKVRLSYLDRDNVVAMEQRVASVETDFRHGLGDLATASGAQLGFPPIPGATLPSTGGNQSFAQTVFLTTVASPYDFGAKSQLLNELSTPFNTCSWRSVYSANARGAEEIMVDELAAALGRDPAELRMAFLPDARQKAVLAKAMEMGQWGKAMPPGFAQGIAFHEEYKSMAAIVVEMDATDPQDPRVTKAAIAADYGLPINPRGLEAQLQGGLVDAISTTLRAGLHLQDGGFLEGSYSQFHYAKQQDTPPQVSTFIFPAVPDSAPGGAGELGVPAAVGAIANAYARATGTKPRSFPIIFPVDFEPFPTGSGSTRMTEPPPPPST